MIGPQRVEPHPRSQDKSILKTQFIVTLIPDRPFRKPFLAPEKMQLVVEKLRESGNANVMLTERGTFFGYGNLVNDMTALQVMRRFAPVVFDI